MRMEGPSPPGTTAEPLYDLRRNQNDRMAGSVPVYRPGAFTFADFLDVVNPLQHVPLISTVYRAATGDEASPAAQVMGGALYGGPLGAAASAMSVTIAQDMGSSTPGAAQALRADHASTSNNALSVVIEDAIGTSANSSDLPGTVLAHAQLGPPPRRYND